MKNFFEEFKSFAMKGNVLDLAIGVIIGGAFGKIISSLVESVIMPLVGIILGGKNFNGLVLSVGDSQIKYGMFISSVIDFLIIAVVLFIAIKAINKFTLKKKEEATVSPVPPKSAEVALLEEIRDLLKK